MNDELERIFNEALDLLEQGTGVETIVARYPAQAAELRPFLLTAARLSRLATQPSLSAEAQSKRAFLAAATVPATTRRPVAAGRLSRLAAGLLALLAVVFLGGATLVGASASAAPGNALYGTKRLVESVRLALATDPERAATLRERFRRERLAEAAQLLAAGREAEITLTGVIEAIDDYGRGEAHWTVDGLPVVVDEQTIMDGQPSVGALVEIAGRTTVDGAVRAAQVVVLSAGLPEPTPAPNPTPAEATPTPTPDDDDDEATVAPGAAPLETATPTATTSPTASPSPSPSPSVTPSPSPSPTLPPPPAPTDDNANNNGGDDNSNDNDDDNANDNDDNTNNNGDDDNANDNDDNTNNNSDDDNANDNDDNTNDNGGDDNSNDNDDNANDNDNDDNSGSGGGDNGNDNDDNDNGGGDDDEGD